QNDASFIPTKANPSSFMEVNLIIDMFRRTLHPTHHPVPFQGNTLPNRVCTEPSKQTSSRSKQVSRGEKTPPKSPPPHAGQNREFASQSNSSLRKSMMSFACAWHMYAVFLLATRPRPVTCTAIPCQNLFYSDR